MALFQQIDQPVGRFDQQPITPGADAAWPALLQDAPVAPASTDTPDVAHVRNERTELDNLVFNLRSQITRMLADYRNMEHEAGEVEAGHQEKIAMLMTMISSLGASLDLSRAASSPDYRRALAQMHSLEGRLGDSLRIDASHRLTAESAKAHLQGEMAAAHATLAQILQQLTALHLRMGSIGALV